MPAGVSAVVTPERRVAEKAPAAELSQVQAIVEGLRRGRIDRALFTANASGYFSVGAIEDIRASLRPMGPVKAVERKWSAKRGGMTFRDYAVQMKKGSVDVTVYLTPQGLYEQFLIAQDI